MTDSQPRLSSSDQSADITASEVGTYAFCAKAWHLEHVLGKAPSTAAMRRRETGIASHDTHGARVAELQRMGPALVRWAVILLALSVVLFAALVLTFG